MIGARTVRLLGWGLLGAVLFAACGRGETGSAQTTTSAPRPRAGGALVVGIDAESDGYNPVTKRFAQAGHLVASAVFDPLATLDERGDWKPFLAESIEPSDDYRVWTVRLRPGIRFHDGTPLNAEAIKKVWDMHFRSLVTSQTVQQIEKVEVADELTVRFHLKRRWVRFPLILTTQVGYAMAPSMLTDPASGGRPVGTGPFVFDEWDMNRAWRGKRNPDYWRKDRFGNRLPYVDSIEFRIIVDAFERNRALLRGDVDLIYTLRPAAILDLREKDVAVLEYDRGDERLIALNTSKPPFDNVHARRALAYATDQRRLIREIHRGVYPPANGPFAPGQLGYRKETGYPSYDPEKAAEELRLFREQTGRDRLAFTYSASEDVDNVQMVQFLQDMWSGAGIETKIEAVPQAEVIFRAVTGQYEAVDWRNWAFRDPDGDYQWWHSSGVRPLEQGISLNVARFSDEEIDRALDAARESTDDEERDGMYAKVAERFGEEVPYIWLGRVRWAIAAKKGLHGYETAVENGTVATLTSKTWIAEIWHGN
ncbi:MAG: ABC transporter substrate-binding protein [Acidimicrobiales bacterium]|nr:MAG: ABC transporter substrate-binding protein [Acidimicrobiales bacterium]